MVGRQDVQGLLERRLRLLPAIQGPIGGSEVVMGGPYPRTLWKLTEELPRLPDRLLPVGAPERASAEKVLRVGRLSRIRERPAYLPEHEPRKGVLSPIEVPQALREQRVGRKRRGRHVVLPRRVAALQPRTEVAPEPRRLRPGQVVLHAILADEHPGLPERSREVSEPKTAVSTLVMHALAEPCDEHAVGGQRRLQGSYPLLELRGLVDAVRRDDRACDAGLPQVHPPKEDGQPRVGEDLRRLEALEVFDDRRERAPIRPAEPHRLLGLHEIDAYQEGQKPTGDGPPDLPAVPAELPRELAHVERDGEGDRREVPKDVRRRVVLVEAIAGRREVQEGEPRAPVQRQEAIPPVE